MHVYLKESGLYPNRRNVLPQLFAASTLVVKKLVEKLSKGVAAPSTMGVGKNSGGRANAA
jgi:hypothetical protein